MHVAPSLALVALLAVTDAAPPVAAADTLALASPPPRVRAWQTGALRPDRLQHATLAFTLGSAAGLVTRQPGAALGSALGLGMLKEVRDTRAGGRFDLGDLAADAAGAVLAAALTRALD